MGSRWNALKAHYKAQFAMVGEAVQESAQGFKAVFDEVFDSRAGIIEPPAGADFNAVVDEPEDGREAIAAAERAAREAARAPYLPAAAPALAFTRVSTTGRTQLEDVVAALRFAPEDVFGVYRVPDRFDHGAGGEAPRYVEWEILHAADAHAADEEVAVAAFRRDARYVARAAGDPTVVDEEVTGTYCLRAGIRPEDCFGLPRLLHIVGRESDSGRSYLPQVDGALVLSRPAPPAALEGLLAEAPLAETPVPFHLELLDWEAVAAWVSPDRRGPQRVPSPIPHLPSSWDELLAAYLEIVGVRSADCYQAGVTRTSERLLSDLSGASFKRNMRAAPQIVCADGEARHVIHAAEHVVIAYRDSAEYVASRERWRAYQRDVLHARLDHLSDERAPIDVDARNPGQSLGPYAGTISVRS